MQALCGVVSQLGQGFGIGDTNAYRNAGAAKYLGADVPTKNIKITDPCQIRKSLVDVKERL